MDPDIMKLLQDKDPDNAHSIPYLGGTTGIGFNPKKVAEEVMGPDFKMDSWDAVLKTGKSFQVEQVWCLFPECPDRDFCSHVALYGVRSQQHQCG